MARILVVDDEESIRLTLDIFLTEAGYDVETAENGETARQAFTGRPFDVVITDIIMPRTSGVTLMNEIRNRTPETQVIMMTGEPTAETASAAVRAGAFDYLAKPITKELLLRTVANAVKVKLLGDERRMLAETNRRYQAQLERMVEDGVQSLRQAKAALQQIQRPTAPPEQLLALHTEIRDLLSCTTHALHTPLWTLAEFARMLQEECGIKLGASGQTSLEHIQGNSSRLLALEEKLNSLAEISRQAVHPQRVPASTLVQTAANELQAAAPERAVRWIIMPDLVTHADPVLLRKLVDILLTNAMKFTHAQPAAEVRFGWNQLHEAYFVSDNGVGFDESLSYKLFRPFQRLHAATDFAGQGMGLAIARRIVHLHGGRIWAQSPPGEGATFFFSLGSGSAPEAVGQP